MTRLLSFRSILPKGGVLIVLGFLIVLLAVGSTDRAYAQNLVLVTNLDQPANGSREVVLVNKENAQQFTTGSHGDGYTLTGMEVDFSWPNVGATAFTVAVHASSNGVPGSKLATLTATRTLHNGTNRFTHTGLDLDPSTSYFVVIEGGQNLAAIIDMTRSASESGDAGWSISNWALQRNKGSNAPYFTISGQSWKMRINGDARTIPPRGPTLVSNWQWEPSGQPSAFHDHDHAQGFTTGSHSLGYTLISVELHLVIAQPAIGTDVKRNTEFAIYTSSGGVPGSKLATLTKPRTIRDGFNRFTHAGLDLSPSTSYFVVMDGSRTQGAVKNTVSDGETGAAGWTIGNSSLYRPYNDTTNTSWETSSQTNRLRIQGTPKRTGLTFPSTCAAAAITPGLYKGTLTGDCPSLQRAPGVNARHVSFSLAQRRQVTLTLESDDFDPHLESDGFDPYLYLGSGKDPATADWTHSNDNIGYNDLGIDYDNSSRLSVVLDAGDYVAELTSLEAGETGSFTLTLETSAPPSDPADATPAVSFVIYHDPDASSEAVDRYNQAVALLAAAGIAYTEVIGDVQDEASRLAGVTDSVLPRFFLGDPTAPDWTSQPKVNNGGLRWLKGKVAELSEE